jgi:hypothetical protein
MGLIRWLLNLLFGSTAPDRASGGSDESIEDVADRIDRFGDRCRNTGDTDGADAARNASRRARQARSVEAAWQIEREFLDRQGHKEHRVVKPLAGRDTRGSAYVRYGNQSRVGGSVGWRNNNPGYIRCDDRLSRYSSIGCDGEYAIFPDEATGREMLIVYLMQEYPSHTLQDALRMQLPPEAGPNAAARILESTRLDPNALVDELTLDQIGTVADTFPDIAGWQLGESLESTPDSADGSGGNEWDDPTPAANDNS